MRSFNTLMAGAVALAGAALMALPAVAQGIGQQISSASVIEEIKKRGTMRVGMGTFVPWAMRDKKGELVGFEIDVANKVAEDMGVKAEFVPTAWDGIIPALIASKFDVIIGGLSITPQRSLTVNFTIPYAHSGQQLVSNKKLAGGFKSLAEYNSASVTITCRRGAAPCNSLKQIFPKATIRQFDDDTQSFQEVMNGNAHAMLASAPRPRYWALDNPDVLFLPSDDYLTKGDESFAVRKGDPDALNFFNNWITYRTSDGWLEQRYTYWFKTKEWADQVELKQ